MVTRGRPWHLNFRDEENQEIVPRALSWNPDLTSLTQCWCPLPWEGRGKCHPRTRALDQSLHRLGGRQKKMQSKGSPESIGMYCLHFHWGEGGADTGGGRKMEAGLKSKKAVTGLYFKH